MELCGIHLTAILQEVHELSVHDMSLKIIILKLQPHLPGANELINGWLNLQQAPHGWPMLASWNVSIVSTQGSVSENTQPVTDDAKRRVKIVDKLGFKLRMVWLKSYWQIFAYLGNCPSAFWYSTMEKISFRMFQEILCADMDYHKGS